MPPLPKRHHFVPRLLIRNFAGEDGLTRYYDRDRPDEGIVGRNPEKVFYRKHLYTKFDKDGGKDVSQEHAFGLLEDAVAPVVRKIISAARENRVPALNIDENSPGTPSYRSVETRTSTGRPVPGLVCLLALIGLAWALAAGIGIDFAAIIILFGTGT